MVTIYIHKVGSNLFDIYVAVAVGHHPHEQATQVVPRLPAKVESTHWCRVRGG